MYGVVLSAAVAVAAHAFRLAAQIHVDDEGSIVVESLVRVTHRTGVEMEALTAASVAALCIYDMCKALSHDIVIANTELISKTGGKRDVDKS